MDSSLILVVVTAALLIGLSKGGLGGPIPVALTTPILSQVLPVPQAVSLALPLLIIADVFALWAYWKQWDMRYVRLMLPWAIVGIVAGQWILASLPDEPLRLVLGIFTLVVVLYKFGLNRLSGVAYQPRDWHGYLAGGASGFASALANVGAPPWTAYMLLQKISPVMFIGTTTIFFSIVNLLKLPGTIVTGLLDFSLFFQILWVVPLIPIGVWIGRRFVNWVDPAQFERLMLLLLFIMSIVLILDSLS